MGYDFAQWDVHGPGCASAILGVEPGTARAHRNAAPPSSSRGHSQLAGALTGADVRETIKAAVGKAQLDRAGGGSGSGGGGSCGKDFDTRVVCLLSNILCYCSDDETADLFASLLGQGGGVR